MTAAADDAVGWDVKVGPDPADGCRDGGAGCDWRSDDATGLTGEAARVGIDENLGWWLGPDGNWYPPELHSGHRRPRAGDASGTVLSRIRPMGPRSRFEPLHFGGTCVNCGSRIHPHEEGWNDPDIDKLMCARCWPAVVASHPSATSLSAPPARPAAPTPRRNDPRWRSGAAGEYLMAIRLHRDLGDRAVVLSDRRVPRSPTVIDHVVVASSGVWVVHSKKVHGLIEYRDVSARQGEDRRLLIGGHDRTTMVDRLYDQVIPVATLVVEPAVPVHGAIAFVEGNWGTPTKLLTRRPYRHDGVWVLWPAALIQMIDEPGPLTHDEVAAIGSTLDGALPRR